MKRFHMVLIGVVLFLMAAVTMFRAFFPFEAQILRNRVSLMVSGVSEVQLGGYQALYRNECPEANPEAQGCTCVALIHGLGDDASTWNKILTAPKSSWIKPVKLYAINIPENQRFLQGENTSDYEVRHQAGSITKALAPACPSWVLVGNSLGGWEAAWIALQGKLRVQKLVLIDAAGISDSSDQEALKLFSNPTPADMRELLDRIFYKPPKLSEKNLKRASEMTGRADLGSILKAQQPDDFLNGRLANLRVPTMVLWGSADRLIPDSVGKEMHAEIPSSIWREIPECGHVPQKECPVPVIQAINDMLRVGAF